MVCRDQFGRLPKIGGFGLVEGPGLGLVSRVQFHRCAFVATATDCNTEQKAEHESAQQ